MTFKTILVAVDGSTHDPKTVEVAADVARHYGAKLLIIHVVAPIFEGSQRDALNNLARIEHMERTEYEMLQQLGGAIVQSAKISAHQKGIASVEALVEVGDPASVIVDTVPTRSVDLIVLGRRGLGTMTGLLLGSVSHKVIQMAHTPCLTVS